MPILVLTLICLAMSAVLAFTNNVTDPIITETEAAIAEAARSEVLPDADGFTQVDVDLPEGSFVTAVYKANNDAGYVFMITCNGYGGKNTMNLICGINNEGQIVYSKTLSHSETAGLGSKTADDGFRLQFSGKDASLDGIDTISGATFSSNYYIEGIQSAFEAYELVK
jgi:electron transport complex protein RnfG